MSLIMSQSITKLMIWNHHLSMLKPAAAMKRSLIRVRPEVSPVTTHHSPGRQIMNYFVQAQRRRQTNPSRTRGSSPSLSSSLPRCPTGSSSQRASQWRRTRRAASSGPTTAAPLTARSSPLKTLAWSPWRMIRAWTLSLTLKRLARGK